MNEKNLYKMWWLHDARWYQEVASEFGFAAANRLNKRILRDMGKSLAEMIVRNERLKIEELTFAEKVDKFNEVASKMWPKDMVDFTYNLTGDASFDVAVHKNFALFMLEKAGSLDQYDCPCVELRNGWFEGLGIDVIENKAVGCKRDGEKGCYFTATIAITNK